VQRHDQPRGGPTDADVSTEELIGDLEDDPAVLSIEPAPQAPGARDDLDLPSGPLTGAATPLGSAALSMVAQTVRTQDYFWALGVERSATGEEIDRAYEALARTFHADAYRQSPDEDRKQAQEIFDRLTEAHRVLRDPAQRRTYTEHLDLTTGGDTQGGAFATRASDAGATTPTKGGGGGTTAGNAAANALYESGMEHLRARRHHEAVEAFRQAARLVPGEAEFRAALGWSLFREAPADARAGRAALAELRRAIQIDGQNLRALHYLANYFAETGQPELAVEELERILQIDPDSTEAADQLRRLRDDGS
jgi:curved DNA-binding protein CbpA